MSEHNSYTLTMRPWVVTQSANTKAEQDTPKEFIAGIRKKDRWELSSNAAEVLEADDDDVVFATTMDELEVGLQEKYQSPHPSLSRIIHYGTHFLVSDTHAYTGDNVAELAMLVKKYGPAAPRNPRILVFHGNYKHLHSGRYFVLTDFPDIIHKDGLWYYDPAFVKECEQKEKDDIAAVKERNRLAKIRAERDGTVTSICLNRLSQELAELLPKSFELTAKGRGLAPAINRFFGAVYLVNKIHGKNAHRNVPSWDQFLTRWSKLKQNTLDKFQDNKVIMDFCAWLDKEKTKTKKAKLVRPTNYLELLG